MDGASPCLAWVMRGRLPSHAFLTDLPAGRHHAARDPALAAALLARRTSRTLHRVGPWICDDRLTPRSETLLNPRMDHISHNLSHAGRGQTVKVVESSGS